MPKTGKKTRQRHWICLPRHVSLTRKIPRWYTILPNEGRERANNITANDKAPGEIPGGFFNVYPDGGPTNADMPPDPCPLYNAPAFISSTTAGSSRVEVSPRLAVSPSATLRKIRRI